VNSAVFILRFSGDRAGEHLQQFRTGELNPHDFVGVREGFKNIFQRDRAGGDAGPQASAVYECDPGAGMRSHEVCNEVAEGCLQVADVAAFPVKENTRLPDGFRFISSNRL